MTTVQIRLKLHYVEPLLALLSKHTEIPIEEIIVVEGTGKKTNIQKQLKKLTLMRIAQECSSLPTLNNHSPEQILEYDQSHCGLWGV